MALHEGRSSVLEWKVDCSLHAAADAGVMTVYDTTNFGSGEGLGDAHGRVSVQANPSGYIPAGVLMANFVDIDQTQQIRNYHQDEHVLGDQAPLATKGYIVTNKIIGTPSPGNVAYLSSSGNFNPVKEANGGVVATPPVGRFETKKDENGYAKISINLPWMN